MLPAPAGLKSCELNMHAAEPDDLRESTLKGAKSFFALRTRALKRTRVIKFSRKLGAGRS
jgi:hypothetical protein